MQGVFTGFATIAVVIGVGALLSHLRILDLTAQRILSQVAFFVGSPALMVVTLSRADVHDVCRPTSSPLPWRSSSRSPSMPGSPGFSGTGAWVRRPSGASLRHT